MFIVLLFTGPPRILFSRFLRACIERNKRRALEFAIYCCTFNIFWWRVGQNIFSANYCFTELHIQDKCFTPDLHYRDLFCLETLISDTWAMKCYKSFTWLRRPFFFLFPLSSQVASATSTPAMATEETTHTLKLTGGATRFLHPSLPRSSLFPLLTHPPFFLHIDVCIPSVLLPPLTPRNPHACY